MYSQKSPGNKLTERQGSNKRKKKKKKNLLELDTGGTIQGVAGNRK